VAKVSATDMAFLPASASVKNSSCSDFSTDIHTADPIIGTPLQINRNDHKSEIEFPIDFPNCFITRELHFGIMFLLVN